MKDKIIKEYLINNHFGKENQINYAKLRILINEELVVKYPPLLRVGEDVLFRFYTKDHLRFYLNELFEKDNDNLLNFTLISTSEGVFVAKNRDEIEECALRLKKHALGELKRYAKLMRLPHDFQVLVDFKNDKLRYINRWQQQRLFDQDSELYEISIDREKNNV
jgi:hypothetical protein